MTADRDPHDRTYPVRVLLSRLAHATPAVFTLVCASSIVRIAANAEIPEPLWSILSTVEFLAVALTAASYGIHLSLPCPASAAPHSPARLPPCPLCVAAVPRDGEVAARQRYVQLSLHHARGVEVSIAVLMALTVLLGPRTLGQDAMLMIVGILGIALAATWYSSITHNILSRWCADCRGHAEPSERSAV
jgi:hypothetical protein